MRWSGCTATWRSSPQTLAISSALIGREGELAALRSALQAARDGAAPLVLVSGFSGIGKYAGSVPQLGPAEARNRFHLVFAHFIQAFATREMPLLLFLDDMQWADSATLELLHKLAVGSQLRRVCLVLAFRDNEVDSRHPLRALFTQFDAHGVTPRHVVLEPLGLESISEHLAATLVRSMHAVRPLARLVLQKTGGNPFFVNEFLKTLQERGLLAPDAATRGWAWDLGRIDVEDITDDLIDLLVERLSLLSSAAREALTLAAAFGNQVGLERLATLLEQPTPAALEVIRPAVAMGLLTWLEGARRLRRSVGTGGHRGPATGVGVHRHRHVRHGRVRAGRPHSSSARGAAMTLVALTGWCQAQDRERTRLAGFDDHLVKPVDIGTLQAMLGRQAQP